jgi:hypothetical protein
LARRLTSVARCQVPIIRSKRSFDASIHRCHLATEIERAKTNAQIRAIEICFAESGYSKRLGNTLTGCRHHLRQTARSRP